MLFVKMREEGGAGNNKVLFEYKGVVKTLLKSEENES